jgi:hypothetical protein
MIDALVSVNTLIQYSLPRFWPDAIAKTEIEEDSQ